MPEPLGKTSEKEDFLEHLFGIGIMVIIAIITAITSIWIVFGVSIFLIVVIIIDFIVVKRT